MAIFGGVALALLLLFWKEFKLLAFDRDYGATQGLPVQKLEVLLTFLLVIAIVIGLQAVGVVLMSAMVVAPAAAARQWTNKLGVMVALAAVFGALAGVSGALISSTGSGLSTGPVIVLAVSAIVLVSLLLAPNRGVLWRALAQKRTRRRLQTDQVLANLALLASQHHDPLHPHAVAALRVFGANDQELAAALTVLSEQGLVAPVEGDLWALTPAGVLAASRLHLPQGGVA